MERCANRWRSWVKRPQLSLQRSHLLRFRPHGSLDQCADLERTCSCRYNGFCFFFLLPLLPTLEISFSPAERGKVQTDATRVRVQRSGHKRTAAANARGIVMSALWRPRQNNEKIATRIRKKPPFQIQAKYSNEAATLWWIRGVRWIFFNSISTLSAIDFASRVRPHWTTLFKEFGGQLGRKTLADRAPSLWLFFPKNPLRFRFDRPLYGFSAVFIWLATSTWRNTAAFRCLLWGPFRSEVGAVLCIIFPLAHPPLLATGSRTFSVIFLSTKSVLSPTRGTRFDSGRNEIRCWII